MKVFYDHQAFTMQNYGGVSRYFRNLIKFSRGHWGCHISGKYSENIYVSEISSLKPFPIPFYFKGKWRVSNYINEYVLKSELKSQDFDIYHPTYYFIKSFPKNRPMVITVHDFIHELFSIADNNIFSAKYNSFINSKRIIAISECTKKDMLKCYPDIQEDKIDVVYHGIEWMLGEKHALTIPINKPYILFTGGRGGYKNFELFVKAVASIILENDFFLICTGSEFSSREKDLFASLGVTDHIIQLFVGENELKSLYENALCFVFPSEYEGFGLPILEAFASTCPVVLSNASCFPEIAGEAALYFDPKSISDIKIQVQKVIDSSDLRDELIKKGIARFEQFSMSKMIDKTCASYEKAIEKM